MNNLLENEAFFWGMMAGISLYQQKVVTAHGRREPIMIGDMLYYIKDGREHLAELFEKACK